MIPSDIFATVQWWAVFFLLGLGFLPLTFLLFKTFFDKGYLFAKIIGLCLTTYAIFLFGLLHILPFTQIGSIVIFLLTILAFFFFLKKKQDLKAILKQHWKLFLFEEILFLTALFFWSYIHSFAPDARGLEKYMDFGFINSILRADYFPPKDMWFTPHFINYYYFGHLMTAVLTKIANIPSGITFNLMLSTIFAFCFTLSFSIAANLYTFIQKSEVFSTSKRLISGFLSAFLVTFAGNPHIIYGFFKAYPNESPVPFWQLPFLPFSFPNAYWYPNATRFIHNTIHEFPMYSWTVADLHGHVLDIPLVLLLIGLLLALFQVHDTEKKKKIAKTQNNWLSSCIIHPIILIFLGFLLALMFMTNAWDGAIYLLLSSLVLFYLYWGKTMNYKMFFLSLLIIIGGFSVFVFPYNLYFKPFASGIGVLCSPDFLVKLQKVGPLLFEANHCQHSLWWELLTLYGFFAFFVMSFLIFTVKVKKILHVDQFVLLLIILSTFLIILPELIYVKDIYPAHYRANTMFKLVFQAFIMLSLVSGFVIVRIVSSIKKKSFAALYIIPSTLMVSLVLLYPYQATKSYYGNLQTYHGLNGTDYLQTVYPQDFAAIQWLNINVKGQPVILEAQGDSYTDYARVSSNTGLPTVLGWTVHEWLWRGSYDIPSPRINEVKALYESKDVKATKELVKKYNIQYIFIGNLEHEKYPALQEKKFSEFGTIVFEKNNTKIYRIN